MQTLARFVALVLPLATTAVAGPLQRQEVAADAKWLLHIDADKLRATSTGEFLVKEFMERRLSDPDRQKLKQELGFDLDVTKIHSITAYGPGFKSGPNGILLVRSDLDLEKALDAAIKKGEEHEGKVRFAKTEGNGVVTYKAFDLAISLYPGGLAIAGRSLESIQKGADVLAGKEPNLASTRALSDLADKQDSLFFFAAADGFNPVLGTKTETGTNEVNNPHARILKMTEGGRITLGQDGDQLVGEVSLKAKNAEVVTQMQQVLQGMIALAALSQSEDSDVQKLTSAAKVSVNGSIVSVRVNFPADEAVRMMNKRLKAAQERRTRAATEKPGDAPKTNTQ